MLHSVTDKQKSVAKASRMKQCAKPPRGAWRSLLCYHVEQFVELWAREYVKPAFCGDIEAALSLSVAVSNQKRGEVVLAFWHAKVPKHSFAALLSAVWDHDHHELVAAAKTRRTLRAMFRYAEFDTSCLPDTVQVWRGTSGCNLTDAAKGYSWTTNKNVACWFAMRYSNIRRRPLVLTSTVSRADVYLYTDERSEREVVLFDPQNARVDGDIPDWTGRAEIWPENIRKLNASCIAELRAESQHSFGASTSNFATMP